MAVSTPAALPSVPSGIAPAPAPAQGPQQINLRPTPIIHLVEPEGLRNPYPFEEDLFGMDFFPNLPDMERLIGSTPAAAWPIDNYFTSPSPFLEDVTTYALPPPSSLLMPLTSLSSPYDHIPRACHGVERRQRSRPSSRGGADYLHFSRLSRHERAAHKTAASRRVAFEEPAYPFALWISSDDPPPSTATATGKLKRRPPTPRYVTSFDIASSSLDEDDECDASPGSPGFDADVEFDDAAEEAERSPEQVGDKERLTIIVPGGKSEAYVAMAFERSCSLSSEDDDDDCPSSADHQSHDLSADTNEKTGLKIKIPVPNPLFMLSLQLASSCRVSDEGEQQQQQQQQQAEMKEVAAARTGGDDNDDHDDHDDPPQSQSGMTTHDQGRERDRQNHLNAPPIQAGGFFASSSRSPTPPVAPPPSPAPLEGRAERRVTRRAALGPYCAIDRLHVRARERPCLSY